MFDPRIERYDTIPVWVKLPNLPFEFWSVDFFKILGNTIELFLRLMDLSLKLVFVVLGKILFSWIFVRVLLKTL